MTDVNTDTRLYSIVIFKYQQGKDATILTSAHDMSSFNYFARAKAQEFCTFAGRTAASRSTTHVREAFQTGDYVCYFQRMPSGVVAVVTSTIAYPARVAFDLVSKVARIYDARVGGLLPEANVDSKATDAEFAAMLKKYQNPADADPIMKVQKEINEVTEIMHNNIDMLLKRGEKIEDLVARSADLSDSAKQWVTVTQKLNRRCRCVIM